VHFLHAIVLSQCAAHFFRTFWRKIKFHR
jgi:hypothetical protein